MEFVFPLDRSQNSTDTDFWICWYFAEVLETIQEMDDAFECDFEAAGTVTPSLDDAREHFYDTVEAKLGKKGLHLIFGTNCRDKLRDSKRKNLLKRKMRERGYHICDDGTIEHVRVVSNTGDGDDETSKSHLSEGIGVSKKKGSYFEEYKKIMSERELHNRDEPKKSEVREGISNSNDPKVNDMGGLEEFRRKMTAHGLHFRDGKVVYVPVVLGKEVSDEPKKSDVREGISDSNNKGKDDMEGLEEFRRTLSAHGLHYRDGKVVYEPVVKKASVMSDKEVNDETKKSDLMEGVSDSKRKDNSIGEPEELKTKLSAFEYQFGDGGLEDSDVEYLSAESDLDDQDIDETGKSDLMQGIGDSKKEANNMGGLEESNRKMTDGGIEHEVNKVSMASDKEDCDEPESSDAMVGIGNSKKEEKNMGKLEELNRKMTDGGEEHEVSKVSMASDKEDSDEPERSDAMVGISKSKKEENNIRGQEELKKIMRACAYHLLGSEIEFRVIKNKWNGPSELSRQYENI